MRIKLYSYSAAEKELCRLPHQRWRKGKAKNHTIYQKWWCQPFHKEDYTFRMARSSLVGMMMDVGSWVRDKFLYNNDWYREEDFRTNYHKKIVYYLSKPSEEKKFKTKKNNGMIKINSKGTSKEVFKLKFKDCLEPTTNHSLSTNVLTYTRPPH